jgi:hypothetical protein
MAMAHGWRRQFAPYWRSPGGRLHSLKGCSGGPGTRRMRRAWVSEAEYLSTLKCRCAMAYAKALGSAVKRGTP